MANAFQQLRQTFQALGKEITPEVSEEAEKCLTQWLANNAQELLKRKTQTEINGTMMQYFRGRQAPPNQCLHWVLRHKPGRKIPGLLTIGSL